MADKKNVLILCTGNSARSIMAEAILNTRGAGIVNGYSAGSQPKTKPNPMAIAHLRAMGHETASARSKSWNEFAGSDAQQMDFIFTVCASAAGEVCPVWPGCPTSAHWGIPDPARALPSEQAQRQAFETAYAQLTDRITLFLAIPFDDMSKDELKARLDAIGRIDEDARLVRQAVS